MTEVVTVENTEEPTESKGFSAVLGHRDFARFWSGQLVSNIGTDDTATHSATDYSVYKNILHRTIRKLQTIHHPNFIDVNEKTYDI